MIYIVLYSDHTLITATNEQFPESHQKGARFFKCKDTTPIYEISEAFAAGWDPSFTLFPKSIKEISH
jgi:hypothetical protein